MDKCLVLRRPSGRYELHELLRQFAEEKLRQDPANLETTLDLHCDFYLAFLNGLNFTQEAKLAMMKTDEEYANFRVSWERCLEHGQIEAAYQATLQLHAYLSNWARYNERTRLLSIFLEVIPPGSHEDLRADCFTKLGFALSAIGKYTTALEYQKKSLEINERLGLHLQKALTLAKMAFLFFRDDYQEGMRCYRESCTYLEQNRKFIYLPNIYLLQGIVYLSKGLVMQSAVCFQNGIDMGRRVVDPIITGLNFDRLGHARVVQGRLNEAEKCFHEMAENLSNGGLPLPGEGYHLGGLARIALRWGNLDEARSLIDESLAIWNRLIQQGSELYAPLGFRYFHRCEILEVQEQYGEMKQTALQALHIFQTHQTEVVLETPQGIGWALYLLSRAQAGLTDFAAARETLQRALQHFREERYTDWLLFCLAAWGEFMVKEDPCARRKQLALELLTLVLDHPRMQEIEAHPAGKGRVELEQDADRLANGLLPAQVDQARQTGHGLSLNVVVDEIITGRGPYYLTER